MADIQDCLIFLSPRGAHVSAADTFSGNTSVPAQELTPEQANFLRDNFGWSAEADAAPADQSGHVDDETALAGVGS